MRYKPRPRQWEPFGQTNHKRCVRRPYVPVDKFGRTTITQLTWLPCTFTSTILRTANNSPTIVHAHRIKIHLVRPISGVACSNGCVDPPARIIAEPSKETSLRTGPSAKQFHRSTGPGLRADNRAVAANAPTHVHRSCRRAFV